MSLFNSIISSFKSDFCKRNIVGPIVATVVSTCVAYEAQKIIRKVETNKAKKMILEQSEGNENVVEGEVVNINDLPE